MNQIRKRPASGFTIIELLMATSVFAVVLIVLTTGILSFTRQYYKGVISSKTQNTARAIIDDVTRAIQFNGGTVQTLTAGGNTGYCIGTSKRYSFSKNLQVVEGAPAAGQSRHAFISDDVTGCNASTSALNVSAVNSLSQDDPATGNPLKNPRELLGENMRLVNFAITGSGDVWQVMVRVAYGDTELLCSPNVASSCDPNGSYTGTPADLTCKPHSGREFCAVSELSTTVNKRVE